MPTCRSSGKTEKPQGLNQMLNGLNPTHQDLAGIPPLFGILVAAAHDEKFNYADSGVAIDIKLLHLIKNESAPVSFDQDLVVGKVIYPVLNGHVDRLDSA